MSTPSNELGEMDDEQVHPKSAEVDASFFSWKPIRYDDLRNSSCETASLTGSDSLNSSLTDDTDEETACSISPDGSRPRFRRHSPLSRSFPRNLYAIQDLSFDDHSLTEEKIHKPSKEQKCEHRKRRSVLALPLVITGLAFYYIYISIRPPRALPPPSGRADRKHFLQNDAPRVRRLIETSAIPESFTVRLSGSRSDLLERSADVLTRCASVQEVQVEWKAATRPPRRLFRHASGKVSRSQTLTTNAVFLLDEDVVFTCDELERGFRLWRLNPDRMVGFFPYHHSSHVRQSILDTSQPPPVEYSTDPILPGEGHYEVVSNRAAFVHKEYVESLANEDNECQQFALSIHTTAVSSKAPLAVAAHPQEQRSSDLVPLLKPPQDVSSCLQEWIEGHEISDLPSEESTYLGA